MSTRSRAAALHAGRAVPALRAALPAACAALLLAFIPAMHAAAASTLSYSGDSMSTVLSEGNQRALLTGNARVTTEDTIIHADRIELFGKDFIYALCSGNVKVVNTKKGMELTSQNLFYDRKQKIARISGNAVMADLKNELVVKGGFIEDRDEDQLTVVQIGVRILKKDMVCRAEFARYYREKKLLELSGLPWVSRKGDEYRAARITVDLDTEEITLEGDVKGQISTEAKPKDEGSQEPAGGAGPQRPESGKPPAAPRPPGSPAPGGPATETPPLGGPGG
jgi:lipopolysaccharide export system protein LptA